MACRWAVALVCSTVLVFLAMVDCKVVEYTLKVAYLSAAPDCYAKVLLGINGNYPGPMIRAGQGDTLKITFVNHVGTEGITMHWHGIRQLGSPWADGTASVSQCPILYGESFTYEFIVDRPGTYFYHGHFGTQRAAGFYGGLIVSLPDGKIEPYHYDDEHMIILNDWWHKPVVDQEESLERVPFSWVGEPQSLLLEGRGRYNCSSVPTYKPAGISCNQSDVRCAPHVWRVERGKTYRLRLASVASLSSLNFKIEGHTMQVVEADGHNIEPFYTDNLDLYSGETYSVLVHADQPGDNYHLGLNVRGRSDATVPTGLGILNYNNATVASPTTPPPKGPAWNDFNASKAQAKLYKALRNNPDPTSHPFNKTEHVPTRTLVFLTTQNTYQGQYKWAINNVTYAPLQTPLLASLVYNLTNAYDTAPPPDFGAANYDVSKPPPISETNIGSGVYQFQTGDVVDLVIQNACSLTANVSEIHPWHLHGHDFWILGYGDGLYDPNKSRSGFNLDNPPARNNVATFPFGWTAIRFKLDNPGAWPFHCHVEWHFHMGMGVMFAHGIDAVRQNGIPASTLGCGFTKSLFKFQPANMAFYTDNLDLHSGETNSVIVHADQPGDNYHFGLNVRGRSVATVPTGLGILNYNNATITPPTTPPPKGPAWNDFNASKAQAKLYKALRNNPDPTSHPFNETEHVPTRSLVFLTTQNMYKGQQKWAVNNVSYVPLQTPLLASLVYNLTNANDTAPPPDFGAANYDIFKPPPINETNLGSGVYQFQTGDVVDLVIQNACPLKLNDFEIHPWHLHGHDFWILGYGDGLYDPKESPSGFNLDNPPARNNVASFPFGWTAIRFKLDNPGAWPFHCHVEWRFHMGMGVMFAHGIDVVRQDGIPTSTLGCGFTKSLFKFQP